MKYDECTQIICAKLRTLKENNKSVTIANEHEKYYELIKIDDCFFNSDQEKCDWLVGVCKDTNAYAHYIELKGTDLNKACSQLKTTMESTKKLFQYFIPKCYIVCSRVPRGGPEIQVLKKKFYKITKTILDVHCIKAIIKI